MPKGPVIGPMVIAGVLVSEKNEKKLKKIGVRDSKMLTAKKREELAPMIKRLAEEIHVIEVPAKEIDEKRKIMSLNELEAMHMAELIEKFRKPGLIIIDVPDPVGKKFIYRIKKYTKIECRVIGEHKADVNYPPVSAASIIAKVERDKKIREIERKNKVRIGIGYPSDPITIKFLEECVKKKEFPDFVRKSWITAKRIMDKKHQKTLLEW